MPNIEHKCKTCRWFRPLREGETVAPYGHCYVKPPVIIMVPMRIPQPAKRVTRLNTNESQEPVFELKPASMRPAVQDTDECERWGIVYP